MTVCHYVFLLYFILSTIIVTSTRIEKLFVAIIGKSDFKIPYTTQRMIPVIKTNNIFKETSSAFFSLIVFTTCGINEAEVKIPAAKPMICVQFMPYGCKSFAILPVSLSNEEMYMAFRNY